MREPTWIDVAYSHTEVPLRVLDADRARGAGPSEIVCAVIDVLRATTTIVTAMGNGCRAAYPCPSPQAARDKAAALRRESGPEQILLGGEQDSRPIPGFDGGNSPREYTPERIGGRILVTSTSNGTKTLAAAGECGRVCVCALANLKAASREIAALIKEKAARAVLIACSGREGGFCEEDAVVAGLLVEELIALAGDATFEESDAARAARRIAEGAGDDLEKMLLGSFWGRHLTRLGMKEDIIFCARRDWTDVVPVLRDGVIE